MSGSRLDSEFVHPSVEPWTGRPLGESRLSDRDRLAAIMQAAALLAHLETANWRLASPWRGFGFDANGLLKGARVEARSDSEPAQKRLVDLVEILFGVQDRIVGKGQAKRLASRVLRRWHRCPGRLPANRIVTQVLDEADFLWQPRFAAGRRALIARIADGDGGRLVVAGRASFERRLLSRANEQCTLEDLVTQPIAGRIWLDCAERGMAGLSLESRLDRGRQLHFSGRWQESSDTLADVQDPAAWILRADCLRHLGKTGAARRLLESGGSREQGLSPEETLEFTWALVGLYLDMGERQLAQSLVSQHPLGASPHHRLGLNLIAAEVAARSGDWQAFSRCLPALEDLREDGEWARRRNTLVMRYARARGRLQEAESLAGQAIARGRGIIPKHEVATLWRDLSSIRLERGDLRGAERAAGHALRRFETIDEPAAVATSRWFADLRLRQGQHLRLGSPTSSENYDPLLSRFSGDPDGTELRARRDLARGRPSRALGLLESSPEGPHPVPPERRQRRRILAARALGWLGRGAEARELLDAEPEVPRGHLEAEELPALWALAGDWTRAQQSVGDDEVGRLWELALRGEPICAESWEALSTLGSFRAARLVFDLQIVVPGRVPRHWLEKAVVTLRRSGAHSFAERLDRTRKGSWQALETFLNTTVRQGRDFGDLFATAGYFDARLEWHGRDSVQVLVAGSGGERMLRAERRDGELVLTANAVDPVIRALFALAAREFEPERGVRARVDSRVRGILGESDALLRALAKLERLASSDVPVLIQGETGTGKELAVRQLHRLSRRTAHPLVSVNCAALSETLVLSDLFGHVRGAFTGADRDRAGVFESARGGIVFLDEIGDLPLTAQGKLLRVLQEGEVRRVGESLPRRIDIRVVAATHRDLGSMVEERAFRADLFYRLKVGSLTLPPLRSRERDVLVLADHFVKRSGHSLTRRARQRLLTHSWPGNVRELHNVLQAAIAMSEGSVIDLEDLELPDRDHCRPLGYHQQVEEFRRELVREALAAADGQRSAAAKRLDVSRQALSYLVRRFGLQ